MNTLRCKPGDLARVIRADGDNCRALLGVVVIVLYATPIDRTYRMPDGGLHEPIRRQIAHLGWWVCELPAPHPLALLGEPEGEVVHTFYLSIPDCCLEPIGRAPVAEELDQDQVEHTEEVTA